MRGTRLPLDAPRRAMGSTEGEKGRTRRAETGPVYFLVRSATAVANTWPSGRLGSGTPEAADQATAHGAERGIDRSRGFVGG